MRNKVVGAQLQTRPAASTACKMRRTLLLATETLRGWQSTTGACLAACGSRAASQPTSATLARAAAAAGAIHCPSAAAQPPPSCRGWASTAAAAATAAADGAAAASAPPLAPCERGPEAQAANELDHQLAAAAQAGGPAAVLELVEEQGERFTELNVISALEALGGSQSGSGMSGVELVRSRPFQTLVGEQDDGAVAVRTSLPSGPAVQCTQPSVPFAHQTLRACPTRRHAAGGPAAL